MQQHQQQQQHQPLLQPWSPESVASLPPPGLSGPSQIVFSPSTADDSFHDGNDPDIYSLGPASAPPRRLLAFVSSPSSTLKTVKKPASPYQPLTSGLYPNPSKSAAAVAASSVHHQQQQQQQPSRAKVTAAHSYHHSSSGASQQQGQVINLAQERALLCMDLTHVNDNDQPLPAPGPLLRLERRQSKRKLQNHAAAAAAEHSPAQQAQYHHSLSSSNQQQQQQLQLLKLEELLATPAASLTQFEWKWVPSRISATTTPAMTSTTSTQQQPPLILRCLIPSKGNLYIQDGMNHIMTTTTTTTTSHHDNQNNNINANNNNNLRCIHDATQWHPAVEPQLSPDGTMVAWHANGEIYVQSCGGNIIVEDHGDSNHHPSGDHPTTSTTNAMPPPIQITFGAQTGANTNDDNDNNNNNNNSHSYIRHGVAEFVAKEEMDRYHGFWWHPRSTGILFVRLDESHVPPFRILHQGGSSSSHHHHMEDGASSSLPYEDHRYPFAGKDNPTVQLGFVAVDRESILRNAIHHNNNNHHPSQGAARSQQQQSDHHAPAQERAIRNWNQCTWFDPPREASEYLARVHFLPCNNNSNAANTVVTQWQNRAQNVSVLARLDLARGRSRTLLTERSNTWINLHQMFHVLPSAVHPDQCVATEKQIPPMPWPLPEGSFSFLYASEQSGFQHVYLYTFVPGIHGEQAIPLRAVSSGGWMVENIVGVDVRKDVVYVTGTFDSVLERHLYALPLLNRRLLDGEPPKANAAEDHHSNSMRRSLSKVMNALSGKSRAAKAQEALSSMPIRLTLEAGMHSIVMDESCEIFVDTSSDLDRPTSSRIYAITGDIAWDSPGRQPSLRLIYTLFDAMHEDNSFSAISFGQQQQLDALPSGARLLAGLSPPDLISFPTSDGSELLHAAVYRPDPRIYGPGPYPLICAVYGGPHVQRVNRSWSQCADMRAQRLRSLGFCVVKCDNRGSSRRGVAFESQIGRRLGRLEVLDQVAAVRLLSLQGLADASRVGVYGWSYGGYLAAMCMARAPDVFSCGVAGAPVTSWDGYDTHYTERYMGHPAENAAGYRESALFDHVPNMRGKLLIVHGLLDENVHFRHTTRLISKLVACNKDYELLLFPEERHSPRRLRDRIYMESKISKFFLRQLCSGQQNVAMDTRGHL